MNKLKSDSFIGRDTSALLYNLRVYVQIFALVGMKSRRHPCKAINKALFWVLTMVTNAVLFKLISTQHTFILYVQGAQWLSGRVLNSRPKDHEFELHRRHCVVVLEQDTFILA